MNSRAKEYNKNVETFQKVLSKYKMDEPIPKKHKRFVDRNMRKEQIKILKRVGRYRPIYGLFLSVFYFLTDLGIKVTVPQSAVIFFAATAITLGGTATGGVVAVKHFVLDKPKIEETVKVEKTVEVTPVVNSKKPVVVKPQISTNYLVIEGSNIPDTLTSLIKKELVSYCRETSKAFDPQYIVSGKIIFREDIYFTSLVLYNKSNFQRVTSRILDTENEKDLLPFFKKSIDEIHGEFGK